MTIQDRINNMYDRLPKSQKSVARYMTNNYNDALFATVAVVAEKAQTSVASVMRFAAQMGFSGFSDMQKQMRREKPSDITPSIKAKDYITAMSEAFERAEKLAFSSEANTACEMMMNAENLMIVGYMDSFGVACEFLHYFDNCRKNVYLSRFIHDWNEMLRIMDSDTTILLVSFAPHYEYSYLCAEAASKRRAKLIVLSNSMLNPYCDFSDLTLVLPITRGAFGLMDRTPITYFQTKLFEYIQRTYTEQINAFAASGDKRTENFVE